MSSSSDVKFSTGTAANWPAVVGRGTLGGMSEHALLLHECRSLSFHCAACTRRMPGDYFEMVRRPTKHSAEPIKSLEMFTGAGGLALGTHLSGFEHVGLIEWDDRACETLRQNV